MVGGSDDIQRVTLCTCMGWFRYVYTDLSTSMCTWKPPVLNPCPETFTFQLMGEEIEKLTIRHSGLTCRQTVRCSTRVSPPDLGYHHQFCFPQQTSSLLRAYQAANREGNTRSMDSWELIVGEDFPSDAELSKRVQAAVATYNVR